MKGGMGVFSAWELSVFRAAGYGSDYCPPIHNSLGLVYFLMVWRFGFQHFGSGWTNASPVGINPPCTGLLGLNSNLQDLSCLLLVMAGLFGSSANLVETLLRLLFSLPATSDRHTQHFLPSPQPLCDFFPLGGTSSIFSHQLILSTQPTPSPLPTHPSPCHFSSTSSSNPLLAPPSSATLTYLLASPSSSATTSSSSSIPLGSILPLDHRFFLQSPRRHLLASEFLAAPSTSSACPGGPLLQICPSDLILLDGNPLLISGALLFVLGLPVGAPVRIWVPASPCLMRTYCLPLLSGYYWLVDG